MGRSAGERELRELVVVAVAGFDRRGNGDACLPGAGGADSAGAAGGAAGVAERAVVAPPARVVVLDVGGGGTQVQRGRRFSALCFAAGDTFGSAGPS
jgi:hypothetical protein